MSISLKADPSGTFGEILVNGQVVAKLPVSGNAVIPNLVGTVSQSGGIPTGAIIERGSNANGEYVRYADGTQICTQEAAKVSSITNAYGALYISALLQWTFPSSFIEIPKVVGASRLNSGPIVTLLATSGLTTTFTYFHLIGSSSSTNYDQRPMLVAIGRWY